MRLFCALATPTTLSLPCRRRNRDNPSPNRPAAAVVVRLDVGALELARGLGAAGGAGAIALYPCATLPLLDRHELPRLGASARNNRQRVVAEPPAEQVAIVVAALVDLGAAQADANVGVVGWQTRRPIFTLPTKCRQGAAEAA